MQVQSKAAPGGDCYYYDQYQYKNCAEQLDLALFDRIHGKFSFAVMKAARSLPGGIRKIRASTNLTLPYRARGHIGQQRGLELIHLGEGKLSVLLIVISVRCCMD